MRALCFSLLLELTTPCSHSRSLYNALYQTSPPGIHHPNWTRSRIRRRHLVSLGIPVNLDEVLPNVNGKPMPALQITTRPSSAPPGPRNLSRVTSPPPSSAHPGSRPGSRPGARPGTPKPNAPGRISALVQTGLGPKPEIDEDRIKQTLAMTSGKLFCTAQPSLRAFMVAYFRISRALTLVYVASTPNQSQASYGKDIGTACAFVATTRRPSTRLRDV